MTRLLFSGFFAAALLMGSWQAMAADGDAVPPELAEWYEQAGAAMVSHAHELAGRGDGRSKLAAAHVLAFPAQSMAGGDRDEELVELGQRWVAEAMPESPDDPLLAWIQASCSPLMSRDVCELGRDSGLDRLAGVAGDRAVTQLMLAQRAGARGEVDAERAHFHAAASAPRFGSFEKEHLELIVAAFDGLELPPATASVRAALAKQLDAGSDPGPRQIIALFSGLQAGLVTMPAYQYPMHQCGMSGDARERSPERHEACERLFERMAEDSHTTLQDLIAVTAMVQLSADTESGFAWRERLREITWLHEQWMAASMEGQLDNAPYVEDWVAHGEREAMRRALAALGVSDTPPDGWLPENADRRNLIEHGQRLPR